MTDKVEVLPTPPKLVLEKIIEIPEDRDSSAKNKERKCRLELCRRNFKDYCEHSSLHGLQYFGEKKLSWCERFLWLLFLGLSLTASVLLIRKVWVKWDTSPVLVTFSGDSIPVSDIPFPAVTICSELKVDNRVFNLTDIRRRLYNLTVKEVTTMQNLSLICGGIDYYLDGDKEISVEAIDFLTTVGTPCQNLMLSCDWLIEDCTKAFLPLLTEEGLCCTFNLLNPADMYSNISIVYEVETDSVWPPVKEWSLEGGYTHPATTLRTVNSYPRRSMSAGLEGGIQFTIASDGNVMDRTCSSPDLGFKLALHNPAELPRMSENYLKLPENRELVVSMTPTITTTMDNLRPYPPEKRGCYFSKEKKLQYFSTYTQENCEFECKVHFAKAHCGCVAFYMPRDDNTPYCGPGSLHCLKEAISMARVRGLFGKRPRFISKEFFEKLTKMVSKCHRCLPACKKIQYDVQTTQSTFDMSAVASSHGENVALTKVKIFFREMQFITKHRTELYGWTDFMANCGGILGLFLGFSILSLVEIIYFMTVRPACKCACVVHPRRNIARMWPRQL